MTETEAATFQHWRGMNGATAYHLIERHADGWPDISVMMNAWMKANTDVACEELREALTELMTYTPRTYRIGGIENGYSVPAGTAVCAVLDKCEAALRSNVK
jgi:hypothetical protein